MGTSSLAKTIIIPATISLTIYLLFSFVLIPFVRRYHQRYAHYIPLHTISAHTSSVRDRIADGLMRLVLRSRSPFLRWRDGREEGGRGGVATDHNNDNISIGDEEGEIMAGMHMDPERRRELERRWNGSGQHRAGQEAEGRLSRDLEEGFMDDSDEDSRH